MMHPSLNRRMAAMTLLFVAVLLAACGPSEDSAQETAAPAAPRTAKIKGTLSYVGEHILAPESTITIELLDTTDGEGKETVVTKKAFHMPGKSPVPYSLDYDMNQIDQQRSYGLRAEVKEQKRLMFISDQIYPVLEGGEQQPVDILLKYVPGGNLDRMAEVVRANNPELSGFYRYYRNAGEFTDCSTGTTHPVASEEGIFELESEYRHVAPNYGDEVFVRVAGKYRTKPARSGSGKEEFLVVMQVEEMTADGDCPQ